METKTKEALVRLPASISLENQSASEIAEIIMNDGKRHLVYVSGRYEDKVVVSSTLNQPAPGEPSLLEGLAGKRQKLSEPRQIDMKDILHYRKLSY